MFRLALALCLVSCSASAQRRVPIEFDAGLPASPTTTQQKLTQLAGRLPAGFVLPAAFDELDSAPDGVTPPTTRLWLAPELKAQFLRAASSGPGPMAWPASTRCAQHLAFSLPAPTLLISGASASCTPFEATVRTQLAQGSLDACLDVDLPERFVAASVVPTGLSQTQLNSFVDQHTQTLEQQLGLMGAGLGQQSVPAGLLPADWVPTMRSVLWKLRESAHTTRLLQARTAYAAALSTLTTNAACFDAVKSAALQAQVQQLDAELAALQTDTAAVIASGLARASQQSACLGARSRTRPTLPVPALTDEEREFVAFWLGGVSWRMRGGGLLPLGSTQNARTFFARRPLEQIARLANGTVTGDRAADSLYCAVFDGWGEWMDMGTTAGGQDMYEDLVQMTDRGRQEVADWTISSIGAAIGNALPNSKSAEAYLRDANFSTTDLYAGGLSMGPCYLYALNPMKNFTWAATGQSPYSAFIESFTAQGEFCFGASLGLGLTRSFLAGTPTNLPPVNFCNGRQCGVDSCGVSCGSCSTGLQCDAQGQCTAPMVDAGAITDPGLISDAGLITDAGAVTDAGLISDAGALNDGGLVDDGGLPDAGEFSDAGNTDDAGTIGRVDAGLPTDGGLMEPAPPSGCGCDATTSLSWLLGVGLLFRPRRGKLPA